MFMTAAQDAPGTWRTSHFAGARISRSKDGGHSWEILKNGLPDRLQASIEAFCLEEARNSTAIYAATTAGEIIFEQRPRRQLAGDRQRFAADLQSRPLQKSHRSVISLPARRVKNHPTR